jgi:hypothetical protein
LAPLLHILEDMIMIIEISAEHMPWCCNIRILQYRYEAAWNREQRRRPDTRSSCIIRIPSAVV